MKFTCSNLLILSLKQYLSSQGIDFSDVLKMANYQSYSTRQTRVPIEKYFDLFEAAHKITKDNDLGIHYGESIKLGSLGDFGIGIASNLSTIGLLDFVKKHISILSSDLIFSYKISQEECIMSVTSLIPQTIRPRHNNECGWVIALNLAQRLLSYNDENIEIKKVLFSHERPNDVSESIRVFGENIEYSTHEDSIVVNSKFVLNNAKFDAGNLSSVVNFQLDNPVQLDGQYGDFIANVKRVIIKNISTNKIKAKDIATDLDVKVSLLNQILKSENLKLRNLINETRYELAINQLSKSDMSIQQISNFLGYSEQSAFHRAFKSWTGKSPSDFQHKYKK